MPATLYRQGILGDLHEVSLVYVQQENRRRQPLRGLFQLTMLGRESGPALAGIGCRELSNGKRSGFPTRARNR